MAIINVTSAQSPYTIQPEQISNLVNFPYVFIVGSGGGTIVINLPKLTSIGYIGNVIALCADGSTTLQMNAYAGDIISGNGGSVVSVYTITGNKAYIGLDATNQGWLATVGASSGGGILVAGQGASSTERVSSGNNVYSMGSTVLGCNSFINNYGDFNTISGGCGGNITASSGGCHVIKGGYNTNIYAVTGFCDAGHTIGGGCFNSITNCAYGCFNTISGGILNSMTNACGGATIAGGSKNFMCGLCYACSGYNVILGGNCNINIIQTSRAGIAGILGGTYNQIQNSYCSFVLGTGITTDADYTAFVNKLSIKNITTSSAGLPAGSIWSDAGQLCVV